MVPRWFHLSLVLILVFAVGYLVAVMRFQSFVQTIGDDVQKNEHNQVITFDSERVTTARTVFVENFKQCIRNRSEACVQRRIRVFCWVLTTAKDLASRAAFVNQTWLLHCDGHAFFLGDTEESLLQTDTARSLRIVKLGGVKESRDALYQKSRRALEHLATAEEQRYISDFGWFLKADDDTFAVIENLKTMLAGRNPDDLAYFGRHFKLHVPAGYASGGAGYVLSRGALRRFADRNAIDCKNQQMPDEDVEVGRCLEKIGVPFLDSRDSLGKQRFHPREPSVQFNQPANGEWQPQYDKYPTVFGGNCCADTTVTFHYVPSALQLMLNHLIYKMSPGGRNLAGSDVGSGHLNFPLPLLSECVQVAFNATNHSLSVNSDAGFHHFSASNEFKQDHVHAVDSQIYSFSLILQLFAIDASVCDA